MSRLCTRLPAPPLERYTTRPTHLADSIPTCLLHMSEKDLIAHCGLAAACCGLTTEAEQPAADRREPASAALWRRPPQPGPLMHLDWHRATFTI